MHAMKTIKELVETHNITQANLNRLNESASSIVRDVLRLSDMTMRELGDAIEYGHSTISRIVSKKVHPSYEFWVAIHKFCKDKGIKI